METKVNKKLAFAIASILLLTVSMFAISTPLVKAWEYPDGTPSDTKYESFGSRADKVLIKLYPSAEATWAALEAGEIDIANAPLTSTYIEKYTSPPWNESINVVSYANGSKAMSRRYVGSTAGEENYTGRYWEGVVNRNDTGIDNSWSFLNMHPRGFERGTGNMTIRWGLPTNLGTQGLNPLYADEIDWQVERLTSESLMVVNPFNIYKLMPWLVEDPWQVGQWTDPLTPEMKKKIRITLWPNATWADGTPLTVADVYFTFVELDDMLVARGFPKPSWISNVEDIREFEIIDPYNFEVLFNVTDASVVGRLAEQIILPKHVWKPIVEIGDPTTFAPDPNVIGSGPWRFKEYVPNDHILLVANAPNSTVQTDLPGSTPITSPEGYFRWDVISGVMETDLGFLHKFDSGDRRLNLTLTNEWLGGPITVNVTIAHKQPNGTVVEYKYMNTTIAAGSKKILEIPQKKFECGSHWWWYWCEGGREFEERWNKKIITKHCGIYYVTLAVDSFGSTYYDDIGIPLYEYKSSVPTPDFKVDIKDVAPAGKAFGSYPGSPRWNSIADINYDYKIDIKDIAAIAKKFGWTGW